MKQEYDFSKGERGRFYHESAKLNLPVYLAYGAISMSGQNRRASRSLNLSTKCCVRT